MTKVSFIVPKYNDELAQTLTNLYDEGGQSAIYDYVNEHYPNWDWDFCEPCDCDSPVYKYESYRICAVCFSDFDFGKVAK
jgi:hypothetical protein